MTTKVQELIPLETMNFEVLQSVFLMTHYFSTSYSPTAHTNLGSMSSRRQQTAAPKMNDAGAVPGDVNAIQVEMVEAVRTTLDGALQEETVAQMRKERVIIEAQRRIIRGVAIMVTCDVTVESGSPKS
ncbi:uncharacterized protein FPOAC1_013234 [Fusarium poae]|jgi:hypothetical protein|uniref:uncharacterized protein n=1 Tax=Fusarium poae TaxID=36050 RepID=UPI001D04F39E|nr:uncharacterized protein FPOAC1_013234 [Fusarium poae]KAG8665255.1 hypothetical protein FPOAC1_013234 [Fusarium poae]